MQVELITYSGNDLVVANAARVSFHKESGWDLSEWRDPPTGETLESAAEKGLPVRIITTKVLRKTDARLINYLAKHKHFSPFNHCFITLRIKAPVFVARQLVKHKFMPWNEVSRRYVDEPPEFFMPEDWRKRSDDKKQGSSDDLIETIFIDGAGTAQIDNVVGAAVRQSLWVYDELLKAGVCPEQARMVLPQNMMTEWWWSGTLGAYLDMLELRLDDHTQSETRDVAIAVAEIIKQLFPVSYAARISHNI